MKRERRDTDWIDRDEYPFEHNYLDTEVGKLHYVDEGDDEDEAIVMLHGNPTWSFLYRDIVKGLRDDYRCVVPDYVGFGLSDKPEDWSYLPRDHSMLVEGLIEELGLENVTLVAQDWGGPIGFSYAVRNPDNVRALVPMNTFLWSVDDLTRAQVFARTVGGEIGRELIDRFNFFVTGVMRLGFADSSNLPPHVRHHYHYPLAKPSDRKGTWVFPREILGSSDWLESLWEERDRITDKPTLLLWGTQDPAFGVEELRRWENEFENTRTTEFGDASHYVQEEKGDEIARYVDEFLSDLA